MHSCNFARQMSHLLHKSISSQQLEQVAPQLIFSGFKTCEGKNQGKKTQQNCLKPHCNIYNHSILKLILISTQITCSTATSLRFFIRLWVTWTLSQESLAYMLLLFVWKKNSRRYVTFPRMDNDPTVFSKEEQATNWSLFKGFSEELTAPNTGYFKELFQYRFKPESHL